MKAFAAKHLDLSIEITPLASGKNGEVNETIALAPKMSIVRASDVKKIMAEFKAIESNADLTNPDEAFDVVAKELALIYPRTADWFMDNVDVATQQEIIRWLAGELRGTAKR